jgi:hypothetical protein
MKKLVIIIATVISGSTSFAQQTAADSIKHTITTLFDAMRKNDSTLLRTTFAKGIVLQSVATNPLGKTLLFTESADKFIKMVGTPHKGIYDERIKIIDIKIDGELASVWAPYKFYIDDKFSHCGVDVFQLIRTVDGWKIIYLVDTRRNGNCVE